MSIIKISIIDIIQRNNKRKEVHSVTNNIARSDEWLNKRLNSLMSEWKTEWTCCTGSWIWLASARGTGIADFTVDGVIRRRRAGSQIQTEEYFPSQRRGKQTFTENTQQQMLSKFSTDAQSTQWDWQIRRQKGRWMNRQKERKYKKTAIKPRAYKHDYKQHTHRRQCHFYGFLPECME